ncbi:MAG: hypothetical protein AAGI38_22180 [Bacteroidota bacterium]
MNFFSHFFFDRHHQDSLFVVGISTPDLLSVFDRRVKLKENKLLTRLEEEKIAPELERFMHGVLRHLEGDRIFHSSDFFTYETHHLSGLLKQAFPDGEIKRGFFLAHIMLELLLDKILIESDPRFLEEFYRHFHARELAYIKYLSEQIAQRPLLEYEAYLRRFVSSRFLFRYQNPDYIIYVLERIFRRVGIYEYRYLESVAFLDLMNLYEKELRGRIPTIIDTLNSQLIPLSKTG